MALHIHTLTYADSRVPDVLDGVFVVEGFARLTVASHGVVLTVVTHSSAEVARGQKHRHVKVAQGRVAVTVALWKERRSFQTNESLLRCSIPFASSSVLTLAGVGAASLGWSPGQVVVEVVTPLTVQTFGIVVAHAPAVNLERKREVGVEAMISG